MRPIRRPRRTSPRRTSPPRTSPPRDRRVRESPPGTTPPGTPSRKRPLGSPAGLTAAALVAAALLTAPAAAAAQEPVLTAETAARIAAFYNAPGTIRLSGESRIPDGTTVDGDIAALGGPVEVAGTVRGDVVVINGDLVLGPYGRIDGDVIVTGGQVEGAVEAVGGTVTVYPDALRFRRENDRIVALDPSRPGWLSATRETSFGRTEFVLTVDGSYNRVEGLPVVLGPRIELGHSNPTVLDARLIYRTRYGLRIHPDEFGHTVRLEQYLGGHRGMLIGGSVFRTIDPIEERGLSDTENSLSTFILHRDYRDHFALRGWSAYLRLIGRTRPFDAILEYRDETHESVDPGTPWSLLSNDLDWRPQPQVAEGDLATIRAAFRWDTRNDRVDPSTGWLIEIEGEQAVEGELFLDVAGLSPGDPAPIERRPVEAEFTSIRLDARRYARLGPRTRVAARAVLAGSPDDGPLPPQRQHVLGGEGSLPGFHRFAFDCEARRETVNGYFPYYGCDRMLLFQAELRYAVLTGESLGRRLGLDFDLLALPELVLFADAGRAWIEPESLGYRASTGPGELVYDAGIGLRLGRLGLYLAAPIHPADGGLNFFVRLGPRL